MAIGPTGGLGCIRARVGSRCVHFRYLYVEYVLTAGPIATAFTDEVASHASTVKRNVFETSACVLIFHNITSSATINAKARVTKIRTTEINSDDLITKISTHENNPLYGIQFLSVSIYSCIVSYGDCGSSYQSDTYILHTPSMINDVVQQVQ